MAKNFFLLRIYACSLGWAMLVGFTYAWGQGCSDAGFCSMGSLKPDQHFSKRSNIKLRSARVDYYWGMTKFDNNIQSVTLTLNAGIGQKSVLELKIPYMKSESAGWALEGVSDISVAFTHNLIEKENYQINATLGAKIPTNNADGRFRGRPLPMYYQISLGSYDAVAGVSYLTKRWLFAVGYQQALTKNGNTFTHSAWDGSRRQNDILQYAESPSLLRGLDVMARVERNFRFARWNFSTGILWIERITRDRIRHSDGTTQRKDKTTGSAVSFLASARYRFSNRTDLQLVWGERVTSLIIALDRPKTPDGLSRERVFTVAYQYNF